MSNRRKSHDERTGQKNYGTKVWRRGAPMFKGLENLMNFEINAGRDPEPEQPRRALSGKDRVRARRGKR